MCKCKWIFTAPKIALKQNCEIWIKGKTTQPKSHYEKARFNPHKKCYRGWRQSYLTLDWAGLCRAVRKGTSTACPCTATDSQSPASSCLEISQDNSSVQTVILKSLFHVNLSLTFGPTGPGHPIGPGIPGTPGGPGLPLKGKHWLQWFIKHHSHTGHYCWQGIKTPMCTYIHTNPIYVESRTNSLILILNIPTLQAIIALY